MNKQIHLPLSLDEFLQRPVVGTLPTDTVELKDSEHEARKVGDHQYHLYKGEQRIYGTYKIAGFSVDQKTTLYHRVEDGQ